MKLKKRKKELFGSSNIHSPIDMEDLNIALSLAMKDKPHSKEDILMEKMKIELEKMAFNDPMKPFCEAIFSIYEKCIKTQ